MEVSKLFVSGLLCGALAFSPVKAGFTMDCVKSSLLLTTSVAGVYGIAKLGAKVSDSPEANNTLAKVEDSFKGVAGSFWKFLQDFGSTVAIIPEAMFSAGKKLLSSETAKNTPEEGNDAPLCSSSNSDSLQVVK